MHNCTLVGIQLEMPSVCNVLPDFRGGAFAPFSSGGPALLAPVSLSLSSSMISCPSSVCPVVQITRHRYPHVLFSRARRASVTPG